MDNAELYYRALNGRPLTGVPPLTFVGNGNPITDYTITGAAGGVGNKTPQCVEFIEQGGVDPTTGELTDNPKTVRTNMIQNPTGARFGFNAGNQYIGAMYIYTNDGTFVKVDSYFTGQHSGTSHRLTGGNWFIMTITKADPDEPIVPSEVIGCMVNRGSYTLLPYEPYGYKIPVSCGGVTTDIYIGESTLDEGESVSFADTKIPIATAAGENTLTVGTTTQPSEITIKTPGTLPPTLAQMLRLKYDIKGR